MHSSLGHPFFSLYATHYIHKCMRRLRTGVASRGGFTNQLTLADNLAHNKPPVDLKEGQPPCHRHAHWQIRQLHRLPHEVRKLLRSRGAALHMTTPSEDATPESPLLTLPPAPHLHQANTAPAPVHTMAVLWGAPLSPQRCACLYVRCASSALLALDDRNRRHSARQASKWSAALL